MTRILFLFGVFFFLVPFSDSELYSQSDNDKLYLKVDYFKAASEDIGSYLHVEQELWKPIHQERVNNGIILGWTFYSVFAGEPDAPYNYIAVNVFDDFDKIDYFQLNDLVLQVYPDIELSSFFEQTRASREVVRTEIWEVNGFVQGDTELPIGNYITKNFFDARGGSGEYEAMEMDFWGAIHETRIKQDILNSWAMYTLMYPDGDARHYTYSTVDFYERLEDLTIGAGMELARIAHPDMNDNELENFFSRTEDSRSLYKTEIWKLLDSVGYD